MKSVSILVCLVGMASAVDVYFHEGNDCSGSWARCTNVNPDTCCSVSDSKLSDYASVAIRGIPSGWNTQLRGYTTGQCSKLLAIVPNRSNNWVCARYYDARYTGGGWNFYSGRRAARSADESECQRPDVLALADGTEYDLGNLSEDDFNRLMKISVNATSPEDIPEQFQPLQIS